MDNFHIYIVLQGASGALHLLNLLKVTNLNGPKREARIVFKTFENYSGSNHFHHFWEQLSLRHAEQFSIAWWRKDQFMGPASLRRVQKPHVGFSHEYTCSFFWEDWFKLDTTRKTLALALVKEHINNPHHFDKYPEMHIKGSALNRSSLVSLPSIFWSQSYDKPSIHWALRKDSK